MKFCEAESLQSSLFRVFRFIIVFLLFIDFLLKLFELFLDSFLLFLDQVSLALLVKYLLFDFFKLLLECFQIPALFQS